MNRPTEYVYINRVLRRAWRFVTENEMRPITVMQAEFLIRCGVAVEKVVQ